MFTYCLIMLKMSKITDFNHFSTHFFYTFPLLHVAKISYFSCHQGH